MSYANKTFLLCSYLLVKCFVFLYFSSTLINFTYLAFTIENIAEFILTKVRLRNSQPGFSSLKNFYADGLKI